jgi:hypothetical protein
MPELIVLAYLYKKKLKMPELTVLALLYIKQVKQVGSGQSRLPDPTQPDKNFQFGSDQLPDLT